MNWLNLVAAAAFMVLLMEAFYRQRELARLKRTGVTAMSDRRIWLNIYEMHDDKPSFVAGGLADEGLIEFRKRFPRSGETEAARAAGDKR